MRAGNGTITANPIEVLERFVEEGWDGLVRAARGTLPLHDAEDAVQEAATRAAAALLTLRDPDSLRLWFGRILENECRNRRKRLAWEEERFQPLPEQRKEEAEEEEGEQEWEDAGLAVRDAAATYENEEFSVVVRREVERLPEEMGAVVEGVGMERRSRAAFAREAGIPARTVGHRLCRAYDLLRPRLARLKRGLER